MAQISEIDKTIKSYDKVSHILKERITSQMISQIAMSLELSPPKHDVLDRAYAMCWASVDLFITTLKALASEKSLPGSVASGSVTLLQFMSEYFLFLGCDTGHRKLIEASKYINEGYKTLEQVNFDIPAEVDEFIHRLENKVFPNVSPITMLILQDLITHLERKYKGAENITTNWEVFITNFNQVNIDSFEEVYIFIKREGVLHTSQD